MTQISGKIYQMKNAAGTENRFPRTVMEAVYGLSTYLQDQFSALADIYMPIEGITESKTGQEFVYRQSAATIKAKSLTLDRIKGKSLAWNQEIIDFSSWATTNGTKSVSNGILTYTVSNAVGSASQYAGDMGRIRNISGHKYYVCAFVKTQYDATLWLGGDGWAGNANNYTIAGNVWTKFAFIGTANSTSTTGQNFYISLSSKTGGSITAGDTMQITSAVRVDLTLLYGGAISGMTDAQILAKFESEFPGYHDFGNKLISNDAESLETVGFNKWDEEWEKGAYNYLGGEKITSNNSIRSKNYISVFPNTDYYGKFGSLEGQSYTTAIMVQYDSNKNYLGYVGCANTTVHTSSDCAYVTFYWVASTYNHDICINLSDPAKNGTYEPYRKSTMPLNLNAIKVYSHNIWDEEWENGTISQSTGENQTDSSRIRSKNYIPVDPGSYLHFYGASRYAYYWIFYYDENKQFILGSTDGSVGYKNNVDVNNNGIVPTNARYLRFYCATQQSQYANDICINISSSFNGRYEPHGILTKTGGLKGNGTWADELFGNKLIERAGRERFGNMTGYAESTYYVFAFSSSAPRGKANSNLNIKCDKYVTGQDADKTIYKRSAGNGVVVKDTSYSTFDALAAAIANNYFDYELANPIEYELAEPIVPTVTAGTTEARISPNSDGLSAPFCCDMTYSASENNDSANAQYALTAGRLLNTHKLWGQDFNGTEDVSGALSGVTTLTASDNITTAAQLISTIATGTAPLSVASTTEVANLHSYTATKLHTQRTLWGQNFDGSGNVTGNLSSVGNIAFSESGKNIASLLYFDTTNSRVGVGASSPAYKLDVNGTLNATGAATLGSTLGVAGNTTIGGTFTVGTSSVNKATTLYGALTASGAVSFTSTLGVTGLSTLAGGIKLTTTKKIWFGDTYYIELDSNNRLHTNAGFYSNSFITAGGIGSGSGGGSNLVKERAYDISLTQIASSDYSELIRAPYINDSDSGFMFAYSPAFLDTASQMHDYVIDAIGHEIGSCDVQWIGIAIGSTYTDDGTFDSGAFLVLAKSGSTYYWYEFEV